MELYLFVTVVTSWCISSIHCLSQLKLGYEPSMKSYVCPDLIDLSVPEGTLSSPLYPKIYPSHVSCTWHIEGKIGDVVTVRLYDLDIEESSDCGYPPCCDRNWLKLGPLSDINDEKKFCGSMISKHHTFVSRSNKLLIKFHISDFRNGGHGFHLFYKTGPNNNTSIACQSNEFQCNDNECVPSKMRCNGFPDCNDGSDEFRCSNKCPSGLSCRSVLQCYSPLKHCDGIGDCPDLSDEIDCGFCAPNFTRCGPNSTTCYDPLTQRCNKILNCVNGEDEVDCFSLCPGKISCDSRRGCYTPKQRCNGLTQCDDASDEKNCVPELCNYEHGGFLCDNGRCIQEVWTCDRSDDCGDGSDERNCLRNSVLTAALMGSLICALLLVIAISCTCRLHALRMLENRLSTTRETPLSRLSREYFFREPPPSYAVATQGDRHRSLCVENLHYPVQVHRGCRRSRRPRHGRPPRGVVPCNCSINTDERTDVVTPPPVAVHDGPLDDASVEVQEGRRQVNKDESSTSESNGQQNGEGFTVDDKYLRSASTSTYVPGASGHESVNLDTLSVTIMDSSRESSPVETDGNHFICDSDTDPLVV